MYECSEGDFPLEIENDYDCWENEMVFQDLREEELDRLAEEQGWNEEFEYYGDEIE